MIQKAKIILQKAIREYHKNDNPENNIYSRYFLACSKPSGNISLFKVEIVSKICNITRRQMYAKKVYIVIPTGTNSHILGKGIEAEYDKNKFVNNIRTILLNKGHKLINLEEHISTVVYGYAYPSQVYTGSSSIKDLISELESDK